MASEVLRHPVCLSTSKVFTGRKAAGAQMASAVLSISKVFSVARQPGLGGLKGF